MPDANRRNKSMCEDLKELFKYWINCLRILLTGMARTDDSNTRREGSKEPEPNLAVVKLWENKTMANKFFSDARFLIDGFVSKPSKKARFAKHQGKRSDIKNRTGSDDISVRRKGMLSSVNVKPRARSHGAIVTSGHEDPQQSSNLEKITGKYLLELENRLAMKPIDYIVVKGETGQIVYTDGTKNAIVKGTLVKRSDKVGRNKVGRRAQMKPNISKSESRILKSKSHIIERKISSRKSRQCEKEPSSQDATMKENGKTRKVESKIVTNKTEQNYTTAIGGMTCFSSLKVETKKEGKSKGSFLKKPMKRCKIEAGTATSRVVSEDRQKVYLPSKQEKKHSIISNVKNKKAGRTKNGNKSTVVVKHKNENHSSGITSHENTNTHLAEISVQHCTSKASSSFYNEKETTVCNSKKQNSGTEEKRKEDHKKPEQATRQVSTQTDTQNVSENSDCVSTINGAPCAGHLLKLSGKHCSHICTVYVIQKGGNPLLKISEDPQHQSSFTVDQSSEKVERVRHVSEGSSCSPIRKGLKKSNGIVKMPNLRKGASEIEDSGETRVRSPEIRDNKNELNSSQNPPRLTREKKFYDQTKSLSPSSKNYGDSNSRRKGNLSSIGQTEEIKPSTKDRGLKHSENNKTSLVTETKFAIQEPEIKVMKFESRVVKERGFKTCPVMPEYIIQQNQVDSPSIEREVSIENKLVELLASNEKALDNRKISNRLQTRNKPLCSNRNIPHASREKDKMYKQIRYKNECGTKQAKSQLNSQKNKTSSQDSNRSLSSKSTLLRRNRKSSNGSKSTTSSKSDKINKDLRSTPRNVPYGYGKLCALLDIFDLINSPDATRQKKQMHITRSEILALIQRDVEGRKDIMKKYLADSRFAVPQRSSMPHIRKTTSHKSANRAFQVNPKRERIQNSSAPSTSKFFTRRRGKPSCTFIKALKNVFRTLQAENKDMYSRESQERKSSHSCHRRSSSKESPAKKDNSVCKYNAQKQEDYASQYHKNDDYEPKNEKKRCVYNYQERSTSPQKPELMHNEKISTVQPSPVENSASSITDECSQTSGKRKRCDQSEKQHIVNSPILMYVAHTPSKVIKNNMESTGKNLTLPGGVVHAKELMPTHIETKISEEVSRNENIRLNLNAEVLKENNNKESIKINTEVIISEKYEHRETKENEAESIYNKKVQKEGIGHDLNTPCKKSMCTIETQQSQDKRSKFENQSSGKEEISPEMEIMLKCISAEEEPEIVPKIDSGSRLDTISCAKVSSQKSVKTNIADNKIVKELMAKLEEKYLRSESMNNRKLGTENIMKENKKEVRKRQRKQINCPKVKTIGAINQETEQKITFQRQDSRIKYILPKKKGLESMKGGGKQIKDKDHVKNSVVNRQWIGKRIGPKDTAPKEKYGSMIVKCDPGQKSASRCTETVGQNSMQKVQVRNEKDELNENGIEKHEEGEKSFNNVENHASSYKKKSNAMKSEDVQYNNANAKYISDFQALKAADLKSDLVEKKELISSDNFDIICKDSGMVSQLLSESLEMASNRVQPDKGKFHKFGNDGPAVNKVSALKAAEGNEDHYSRKQKNKGILTEITERKSELSSYNNKGKSVSKCHTASGNRSAKTGKLDCINSSLPSAQTEKLRSEKNITNTPYHDKSKTDCETQREQENKHGLINPENMHGKVPHTQNSNQRKEALHFSKDMTIPRDVFASKANATKPIIARGKKSTNSESTSKEAKVRSTKGTGDKTLQHEHSKPISKDDNESKERENETKEMIQTSMQGGKPPNKEKDKNTAKNSLIIPDKLNASNSAMKSMDRRKPVVTRTMAQTKRPVTSGHIDNLVKRNANKQRQRPASAAGSAWQASKLKSNEKNALTTINVAVEMKRREDKLQVPLAQKSVPMSSVNKKSQEIVKTAETRNGPPKVGSGCHQRMSNSANTTSPVPSEQKPKRNIQYLKSTSCKPVAAVNASKRHQLIAQSNSGQQGSMTNKYKEKTTLNAGTKKTENRDAHKNNKQQRTSAKLPKMKRKINSSPSLLPDCKDLQPIILKGVIKDTTKVQYEIKVKPAVKEDKMKFPPKVGQKLMNDSSVSERVAEIENQVDTNIGNIKANRNEIIFNTKTDVPLTNLGITLSKINEVNSSELDKSETANLEENVMQGGHNYVNKSIDFNSADNDLKKVAETTSNTSINTRKNTENNPSSPVTKERNKKVLKVEEKFDHIQHNAQPCQDSSDDRKNNQPKLWDKPVSSETLLRCSVQLISSPEEVCMYNCDSDYPENLNSGSTPFELLDENDLNSSEIFQLILEEIKHITKQDIGMNKIGSASERNYLTTSCLQLEQGGNINKEMCPGREQLQPVNETAVSSHENSEEMVRKLHKVKEGNVHPFSLSSYELETERHSGKFSNSESDGDCLRNLVFELFQQYNLDVSQKLPEITMLFRQICGDKISANRLLETSHRSRACNECTGTNTKLEKSDAEIISGDCQKNRKSVEVNDSEFSIGSLRKSSKKSSKSVQLHSKKNIKLDDKDNSMSHVIKGSGVFVGELNIVANNENNMENKVRSQVMQILQTTLPSSKDSSQLEFLFRNSNYELEDSGNKDSILKVTDKELVEVSKTGTTSPDTHTLGVAVDKNCPKTSNVNDSPPVQSPATDRHVTSTTQLPTMKVGAEKKVDKFWQQDVVALGDNTKAKLKGNGELSLKLTLAEKGISTPPKLRKETQCNEKPGSCNRNTIMKPRSSTMRKTNPEKRSTLSLRQDYLKGPKAEYH